MDPYFQVNPCTRNTDNVISNLLLALQVDRDGTVMDEGDDGSSSSGSDDEGDSDDSDAMDTDAPKLRAASQPKPRAAPVIDEDGFEVVQRKGRR